MRPIDQPFPVPALVQGEAHCRTAGIQLTGEVRLLSKPTLNQIQVKAARKFQIRPGRRIGMLLGRRRTFAPVIKQVFVDLLHMPGLATLAAAAADHPRGIVKGVQLLLLARRAFAFAHVLTGLVLEAVVGLEPLQEVGA
ncbi:hypothetical protein D3C86_1148050 [compost metagenome]